MSQSRSNISSISYLRLAGQVLPARRGAVGLVCLGLALLHTVLVLLALRSRADVQNVDYWYHLYVGTQQDWSRADTLAHGFYPLGYPWLLRAAIDHGIDGVRLGQLLSWLGSVLALTGIFVMARRITGSLLLAALAGLLLIANHYFLELAVLESNDMLAAGLHVLAITAVWLVARDGDDAAAWRLSLAAGCLLGLAYLMRYTALTAVPCALLGLLIKRRQQPRHALRLTLVLVAAFLVTAAVQIVPAVSAYGQPFYNTQAKNVWFGVYGNQDWINNWNKVPPTITLGEVIQLDPARFLRHWSSEFLRAFTGLRLWSLPLHLAWIGGGVVVATTRRLDPGDRVLLLAALLVPMLATALAWLAPRFLLVPLLLEPLLIVALVGRLSSWLPVGRGAQLGLGSAALGLLIGLGQAPTAIGWLRTPGITAASRVTATLRLAGMQEPTLVGTNDWLLHAADTIEHVPFVRLHTLLPYPADIDELLGLPQTAGLRYLVLNYGASDTGNFSAIQPESLLDKRRLVPLTLDPAATAFCILPCQQADSTPDRIVFANGMRLTGHRLRSAHDAIGLYLYWQADQPLDKSYSIRLRVLDEQGRVVAQQEHLPQLGTYPTSDWASATTVVDFHLLELAAPRAGRYRLELTVRDQQSQEPVAANRPGASAATAVIIQEFSR